jgi:geranylgeranyl reductase family protein
MGELPVVIVGGGPGGSATALALRRRRIPAIVLDRAVFPRDKVCGDVLLPPAVDALDSLGLDTADLRRQAYLCTGGRYLTARGAEVSGDFRDPAGTARPWWMIRRVRLDAWLLEAARRAGAEVREGWCVQGLLFGDRGRVTGVRARRPDGAVEVIAAAAVVGADGASSVVAREVGAFARPPEHTCLAARGYVEGISLPAPYLEIFTTTRTLPGCAWIAPIGPREANVGIGVIKADLARLGRPLRALFAEVSREVRLLSARLGGRSPASLEGWSLPGATERRRIAGAGYLLVGDAGAMVDPFTGHGIQNALWAGAIAGEVLSDAISRGDLGETSLSSYAARCRDAFLDEAILGGSLQRLHARAWLMQLAAALCNARPGLRDTLLGLIGHSAPRRALLSSRHLGPALLRARPLA